MKEFRETFPRIAIVHEWFTGMRGGEKCVEALCELFPQATLYTLVHVHGSVSETIEQMPIHTSFIQRVPFARTRYRHYLPLFPLAVERFDLRGYDIVISSHHAVAKGVKTDPTTLHICYCHTPMRYIWHLYDDYFGAGKASTFTRTAMRLCVGYLRRWDVRTARNPHHFIANSQNVRRRILELYQRDAAVIYPPVDTARFRPAAAGDQYFLIVSALVPYKRIDLAIEAFNHSGEQLLIIGDGPERERLRSLAAPNISFLGWQPDDALVEYYANCKALIFPGEEDFGIVPVEAMASGKPVIAYAKGGALETVIDTPTLKTGVLFAQQTKEALHEAIERFKQTSFSPDLLRRHALQFDRSVYKQKMASFIMKEWERFRYHSSHLVPQER